MSQEEVTGTETGPKTTALARAETDAAHGTLPVIHFAAPQRLLKDLDAEATASLITAATDVALIVDGEGVIRDVAVGSDDIAPDDYRDWIGQAWTETVTVESRPKVVALLKEAASKKGGRRSRHINHPSAHGSDVPVLYSAIQVGNEGRVVALGRDMRAAAVLQQRLVEAQQSMERDYARLRHMETRYRLLFRSVGEAILIVDAATLRLSELNPAAERLLGEPAKRRVGQSVLDCFDPANRDAVSGWLAGVRAAGRGDELAAQLVGDPADVRLAASLFRQEAGSHFLIRVLPAAQVAVATAASSAADALARAMDRVPDGFVVTDFDGRVLTANAAFVEMIQLAVGEQVQGESLDRWLGRSGVDMNVLIANLRQHGSVRLFATTLRGQYGSTTQVEISAASVPDADLPCLGFTVRDVGRRLAPAGPRASKELPRTVGQLTELVGRVPLKEIVGETTDLIEQLCIQAALELTADNRASAAEMLGLSRQSLYVKLRRYGLGDLGSDTER